SLDDYCYHRHDQYTCVSPHAPTSRHIFSFNDTSTTEIYTLSLHDALPISTVAKRAGIFTFLSRSAVSHTVESQTASLFELMTASSSERSGSNSQAFPEVVLTVN